jgi:CheY-like chemotaxis protein
LGLTIARQLATMMGGQVGLEERDGPGATFWFTVALTKVAQEVNETEVPTQDISGAHILIVDDHPVNRRLLTVLLTFWGCRYQEAESGDSALAKLKAAADAGEPFDLALLDMQMEGMDGAQLGARIKADAAIQEVRLVMLTSFARRGDARIVEDIGFSGYLTKPIKHGQLYQCLVLVLGTSGTSVDAPELGLVTRHTLAEKSRRPFRILLAEDNATNQKVVLHILTKLGYHADAVADGSEVLTALQRIDYDLVLMDCHMPEMDGFEASKTIRSSKTVLNRQVPIIALTADAVKGARERCLDAGMTDYLAKPVGPKAIEQMLSAYLGACPDTDSGSK